MNPLGIIEKYYQPGSPLYGILTTHSRQVATRALRIAGRLGHLQPNLQFIEEAAMLHDIGIFLTRAPQIECFGEAPYICHGILGSELLQKEGLPAHALVCERHTGVGISREEITARGLPLPQRDLLPISLEEKIICFADKFFSKIPSELHRERSTEEIEAGLLRFGRQKVDTFAEWRKWFGE